MEKILNYENFKVSREILKNVPATILLETQRRIVESFDFIIMLLNPSYKYLSEQKIIETYSGDIFSRISVKKGQLSKIIPVIVSGNRSLSMPDWISTRFYLDFSSEAMFEQNYEDLICTLNYKKYVEPLMQDFEKEFYATEVFQEIHLKGLILTEISYFNEMITLPFALNSKPSKNWGIFLSRYINNGNSERVLLSIFHDTIQISTDNLFDYYQLRAKLLAAIEGANEAHKIFISNFNELLDN
ncbi:hypothetical protein ACFFJX_02380 [Pseudarcicella hirudinis]|uniref:hypothetical protein n=1 Tax=Pseudarcicella hirudinis TaxID=1079859 RepID=UPI0035E65F10